MAVEHRAEALDATPKQLVFNAVQGGIDPPSQVVMFEKNDRKDVNRATYYDASWLHVTLSPWRLVPSDQLQISVNVAGLTAGVYKGTVTIAAMKDGPVSIPVTLFVNAPSLTVGNSLPPTSVPALVYANADQGDVQ
jgi:hypothetical protein